MQNIAQLREKAAALKEPTPSFLPDDSNSFIKQSNVKSAQNATADATTKQGSSTYPTNEYDFIPGTMASSTASAPGAASPGGEAVATTENTTATPTAGPTSATPGGAAPNDGQYYDGQPDAGSSGAQGNFGTADFGPPNPSQPPSGQSGIPGWFGSVTPTTPGGPGSGPGGGGPAGDVRVREEEGSFWGGNKPDYLGNMPRDMPSPTNWEVTGDQLVENRMASLMESDNPVFQSLREATMRAHAARGGKNSLMAARAAVTQMADMAFKIGSQDAQTLARSAEFNAAMANQFGLAEQRFIHNALLSDQNYRQGVMMIREQSAARINEIGAETSGRLATISAQFAGEMQLEDRRTDNQIRVMDRAHGHNLERDELNFQHNWALNEQGQAHTLERMDRQTDNNMREANNQFRNQFTLTYLSENSATQRQIIASMGEIRGNPNLKPDQAAAGARDLLSLYNSFNEQTRAFFGNPRPGADPNASGDSGGGNLWNSPAFDYTSYTGARGYSMGQGGYQMYAPPTMRFWGGSGTVGQPMYGSNQAYAQGTRPQNAQTGPGRPMGGNGTRPPPSQPPAEGPPGYSGDPNFPSPGGGSAPPNQQKVPGG